MTQGQSNQNQPAPFLRKTYDLVSDPSTDPIISWGEQGTSFVVWKPAEFARDILPKYFKHNNFSSFVRQLNTYGFRKVDPDNWEFVNEGFLKHDQSAINGISRRKPTNLPLGPRPWRAQAESSRGAPNSGDSSSYSLKRQPRIQSLPSLALRPESRVPARSSAFNPSAPIDGPDSSAEERQTKNQAAATAAQGKPWGTDNMALGGLQRFGRLVDNVLNADRQGLFETAASAPAQGESPSCSDTNSEGALTTKRQRKDSTQSFNVQRSGQLDEAAWEEENNDGGAMRVARPKPGHLENMTQALLGDVADQLSVLKELSAEVQTLKAQQAAMHVQVYFQYRCRKELGNQKRGRGRPPGLVSDGAGDWQGCLEQQLRHIEWLHEQFEEQTALNEEAWANQAALTARIAKTEEHLSETGDVLMKEASHIFITAAVEKRLEDLERAQAAVAKENVELKTRIEQLDNALKAERDSADIRVWRAMLQAGSMKQVAGPILENLQSLIDQAGRRQEAVGGAPEQDTNMQGAADLFTPNPAGGEGLETRLASLSNDKPNSHWSDIPLARTDSPGPTLGSDKGGQQAKRGEPLPGSMAALGFSCSPKNYADGITGRVFGKGGSRGRRRPTHADKASGRYGSETLPGQEIDPAIVEAAASAEHDYLRHASLPRPEQLSHAEEICKTAPSRPLDGRAAGPPPEETALKGHQPRAASSRASLQKPSPQLLDPQQDPGSVVNTVASQHSNKNHGEPRQPTSATAAAPPRTGILVQPAATQAS